MKINLDSLFNVDRRVVFVGVFLAILIPLVLVPYAMPCKPTRDVLTMYDAIQQAADAKKPVLLSFEFDPTGAAEQEPMARCLLRQLFARGGRAVIMCKSGGQLGQELHLKIIDECAQEYGAKYGEDYVYLPFITGSSNVVIGLGRSLAGQWPKDIRGTDLSQIPLTSNITRLADFEYIVIICSSLSPVVDWLTYGQGPYNLNMGFGVLGNVTPDCSNYVQSGQIKGLLGGLIGAAQYEQLLMDKGIGLARRFSTADLANLRGLCGKLADPGRSPVAAYVWNSLPPQTQQAVSRTAKIGLDQLSQADKEAVVAGLNQTISRPDVVTADQLKGFKVEGRVGALVGPSANPQVLRRQYVESQFPRELGKAYGAGRAMLWMTPQSAVHVVLIVAILFGNVCYFLERRRARKAAARGAQ